MITISIIENNARHAQLISNYIDQHSNYQLLSTSVNGFEFLEFCYNSKQLPNVALIDVEMNVMDGVTLVDFVNQFYLNIKCIAVTSHHHKEMIEDMMACGAMGVVFKFFVVDESVAKPQSFGLLHRFESLDMAIEAATADVFYLDKLIEADLPKPLLLEREQLLELCVEQRTANAVFDLNRREYEIALLCAGTNARLEDIAKMLCMSVHNLKLITSGIYKKMNVADRVELTFLCNRKGIVKNARNIVGKEKV